MFPSLVKFSRFPNDELAFHASLRLLSALLRIGWSIKRQSGSHRVLSRSGFDDFVFAFHENEESGPRMLARISKRTGLTPSDLWAVLRGLTKPLNPTNWALPRFRKSGKLIAALAFRVSGNRWAPEIMKVENPPSRLFAVTPSRGLKMALLITAVIVCLLVVIFIAARPMRSLYGPLVWHASYENAPLARVIDDLERAHVIPAGTVWADASLKNRRISVRWLLADPEDVLGDLATRAVVRIGYPVGYHGDMIGPAELSPAEPTKGSVVPRMDRELERRQLSLSKPGA